MRPVNDATVHDNYPLPISEELLERMAGHKYYTILDLKSGFWQIPLTKGSILKVTVTTSMGPRSYTVAIMGLKNSPACFQRCMDEVLDGLTDTVCCIYLDDCSIPSDDFDEHMSGLEQVLDRLMDANLALNAPKCKFAVPEVVFLGHMCNAEGLAPVQDKVEKVNAWPQPHTMKQLR